jgi:hypothetical protein
METMKNPITIANMLDNDAHSGDQNGDTVDMQQAGGYETALALASVGAFTGSPTTVEIYFEEDDDSGFGSATVVEGGEATEVSADSQYNFELKRSKRYIRAVLDFTGGSSPTAEVAIQALLTNWAKPFNVR